MKKTCLVIAAALVVSALVLHTVVAQTPRQDAPAARAAGAAAKEDPAMNTDLPPRKIVVGSLMHSMYSNFPGVEKRCQELAGFIDQMAKEAKDKFRAGLDIAALPEVAVNGGAKGGAKEISVPLEGKVMDILGAAARRNKCYVTVPLFWTEDAARGRYFNILALLDRDGNLVGIYRKVHAVGALGSDQLEGGCLPGKDFPVFRCDFGTLGLQICYDMSYDDGWATLARKGAELVIWSTQSPQILGPQARAHKHHYYILTSTWRNNISLIDPTGHVIAQKTEGPTSILVDQIDLSYALVGWQPRLGNGQAFIDKYGKAAVGFRYSEAEDGGIFWSNDPNIPVRRMVRELGLEYPQAEIERNRLLQDKLRGGPPSLD